jgi:uncharacterized protein (TIGR03435 family)
VTVTDLIVEAYGVMYANIMGAPAWSRPDGDTYDITAIAPGEKAPGADAFRLMLQAMLAERFGLRLHREAREVPVYELAIAGSGLKVRRVTASPDGKTPAGAIAFSTLKGLISSLLDRPLVDKTGLGGLVENKWNQAQLTEERDQLARQGESNMTPRVFEEVRARLGLTLKAAKDSFEVLVVDRVERPTEN